MTSSRVSFPDLDGLRTLAFAAVFLQHGCSGLRILLPPGWTELEDLIFRSAGRGVSLFFVLSGFLITYLLLTERDLRGRIDIRSFYIRRALRIWPLYFTTVLFAFVGYPALKAYAGYSPHIEAGHPLWYFTFLGNFDVMRLGDAHGALSTNVTWSVAIEEQFYAVWPLALALCPPGRTLAFLIGVVAGSTAFRAWHFDDGNVLYFHTLSVVSDMAIGGIAAHLAQGSERFRKGMVGLGRVPIVTAYIAGLIFVVAEPSLPTGHARAMLSRLLTGVFFAFVILEQCFAAGSLVKMSRLRLVSWLGTYTYGLYLLHPVAITLVIGAARVMAVDPNDPVAMAAIGLFAFVGSLVLSLASYYTLEKPFLRLKERYAHVHRLRVSPVPAE